MRATHLRLLQVSSSGTSNLLTIMDRQAPTDLASYQASNLQAGIITNADTGVVLTWGQFFSADSAIGPTQYGMAITTGTSVSIVSAPSVPGQPLVGTALSPVFPVLQAEDGSFFGSYQTDMVAFDQAGNVRWMVPNEYPLLATPDGGMIGQSGITYDQNGNATGQGNLYTQSWTYNMYQVVGLVDRLAVLPTLLATSFWAFQAANNSANLAAALPLPDRVEAITDVVVPDPLGLFAPTVKRQIDYKLYQGTQQVPASKNAVISEHFIVLFGPPPDCPSNTNNPVARRAIPGTDFPPGRE